MYERGDKEEHLDTIRYEIDMLDFVYDAYRQKQRAEEWGDFNTYLECFLLHYRNLIEFFSEKKPRRDGTDLRVFLPKRWAHPGADVRKLEKLTREDLYEKYWSDLSRYLDHCTTYRANARKRWNAQEMYDELNPTLTDFEQITQLRRLIPGGVKQATAVPWLESASTATVSKFQSFPDVVDFTGRRLPSDSKSQKK